MKLNLTKMNKKLTVFSVILVVLGAISCGNRKNVDACNYTPANLYLSLNLNDIAYSNLIFDNRYVYHQAGTKGLIIYRATATDYRVFERASPLDPTNNKAVIQVDNVGLMSDTLHNQYWDMSGMPYSGSSTCQIYRYPAYLDGHYLNISNY